VLWLLFAGFAVLDWYAVWRGRRALEAVAKPLAMVALTGVALAMGAGGSGPGRWLLVALVLCLAGDVALLSRTEPRFLAGLGAFLLGHVAYVAALRSLGEQSLTAALPGLAAVLLLVLVVGRPVLAATRRRGEPGLAGAVAAYMVVIGTMVVTAFGTTRPLVAAGALVFMASDAVLAFDRFVRPQRWAPLVVMVTYHLGQGLIVAGALR
jgi:uncharacterized membrane protein YhhN